MIVWDGGEKLSMHRTDWIDGILLLTIGIVFHVVFPELFHAKLDFTLAALFLILVTKQDLILVIVSIVAVALYAALISPLENGFPILLIEKLLTGGMLVWIVKKTRSYFSTKVAHLCVIGVLGTILHGLLFSLLVTFWNRVTWGLFFDLLKEVTWPVILWNMCAAYVFYVTLEYGEKILQTSCCE